ncbi:MAG: hypothetical protein O3B41_08395 [Bacteroidetes bacterium]|nr:hypothetical protein [Bacteroidota bacterium]
MTEIRTNMANSLRTSFRISTALFLLLGLPCSSILAQDGARGSRNMELVSHLPLGGMKAASGSATAGFEALGRNTSDVVFDQSQGRPFVFVGKKGADQGVVAINISDDKNPIVVGEWRSEAEVADLILFKSGPLTYLIATHPSSGATVLNVSDPDEGQFDQVARISVDGGLHHGFAYRHSNGRGYFFGTGGGDIFVYDLDRLAAGATTVFQTIPLPEEVPAIKYGFHSVYVQYEATTESDRLYAAGAGGYYILNVTDVTNPTLITAINSAAVQIGRSISASPDGSHVVTGAGYRTSPIRIFDLRPAFEGTVPRIRTAVGAWTANWQNYAENHTMRWPLVFAAAMDDGLQIFNMMNPFEPFTVGYYHTWDGPAASLANREVNMTGAWDVDVRNSDGLIAVTDVNTGLWLFRLEGFENWDGRGWGYPNVSSVQDWENGPTRSASW